MARTLVRAFSGTGYIQYTGKFVDTDGWVYVATYDQGAASDRVKIHVSKDGGSTWTQFGIMPLFNGISASGYVQFENVGNALYIACGSMGAESPYTYATALLKIPDKTTVTSSTQLSTYTVISNPWTYGSRHQCTNLRMGTDGFLYSTVDNWTNSYYNAMYRINVSTNAVVGSWYGNNGSSSRQTPTLFRTANYMVAGYMSSDNTSYQMYMTINSNNQGQNNALTANNDSGYSASHIGVELPNGDVVAMGVGLSSGSQGLNVLRAGNTSWLANMTLPKTTGIAYTQQWLFLDETLTPALGYWDGDGTQGTTFYKKQITYTTSSVSLGPAIKIATKPANATTWVAYPRKDATGIRRVAIITMDAANNVYAEVISNNTPPNAPVITYPVANSWINTRTPIIQWNFSDPDAGDTQSQYLVQLVNSAYSAVIADTGWLSGNVRSWQMPAGWITADGTYYVRMQVKDSQGAISGPGTGTPGDTNYYNVYFGVDTVPPNAPTLSIGAITGTTIATTFSLFSDSAPSSGIASSGLFVVVDDTAGNRVATHQPAVGSTSFVIPNLTPNTAYYIWVTYLDTAGNWAPASTKYYVVTDTRAPDTPAQTNGIPYAASNSVSWSAFSDGPVSSGLLLTTLYLQKWNGSSYVTEPGYPKSVVGLSNAITGLTPATQYRWGVTYTDNVGNVSPLAYTNFTTNSYAVTTIENVVSGGKVYNARPKIRLKVIDANDATLKDLEFQRSSIPTFALPTDVTMSGTPQSFNVTSPFASSTLVTFTPASALPTGISYLRARAYDGKDWGPWSTPTNFTIETPTYPTTIAAGDTTISKRTIDDIRSKVNAVRQARGLAVIVWTDSTIKDWTNGAAGTSIRAIHLIELRQAINDIYVVLGGSAPTWGVDPIIDTTINRKGQHWIDLRNALALA